MPAKKFSGNYLQAIQALPKIVSRTLYTAQNFSDSIEVVEEAKRVFFVDTYKKTYDEFKDTWKSENIDSSLYVQGDIDTHNMSFFFKDLILQSIIKPSSLIKNRPQKASSQMSLAADYLDKYRKSISFAYCDDNGDYCGFSLETSIADPDYWIVSIVKKTNAIRSDRDVTILMNCGEEEISDDLLGHAESIDSASKALSDALNSKAIAQALRDLFNQDNTANVNKLIGLAELFNGRKENLIRINDIPITFFDRIKNWVNNNSKALSGWGVTLTSATLGAVIGGAIGSIVPVIGTIVGATFGATLGAGIGISGLSITQWYKKNITKSVALASIGGIGSVNIGAAIGAIIGTFIFPGIGTAGGAILGAGLGALVGVSIFTNATKNYNVSIAFTALSIGSVGTIIGAIIGSLILPGPGTVLGGILGPIVTAAFAAACVAVAMGIKKLISKPENFIENTTPSPQEGKASDNPLSKLGSSPVSSPTDVEKPPVMSQPIFTSIPKASSLPKLDTLNKTITSQPDGKI